VPRDAEVLRLLLHSFSIRAVADEAERRVDAEIEEPLERRQDVRHALDRGHAADPADDEAIVRDAEQAAMLLANSRIVQHA